MSPKQFHLKRGFSGARTMLLLSYSVLTPKRAYNLIFHIHMVVLFYIISATRKPTLFSPQPHQKRIPNGGYVWPNTLIVQSSETQIHSSKIKFPDIKSNIQQMYTIRLDIKSGFFFDRFSASRPSGFAKTLSSLLEFLSFFPKC